jgi:hypothetical protein
MIMVIGKVIETPSLLLEWASNWHLRRISVALGFLMAHTFGNILLFNVFEKRFRVLVVFTNRVELVMAWNLASLLLLRGDLPMVWIREIERVEVLMSVEIRFIVS